MSGRDAAMVNGALIALGILGIVDNVAFTGCSNFTGRSQERMP
jgi:hypothetical protein